MSRGLVRELVRLGSSICFSVFVALMGVLLALTPIVAHQELQ